MSYITRKSVYVSDTNQAVQPKKMARGLKILDLNKQIFFFIKRVKKVND